MIISIGVDCGVSEILKKYNLRSFSFPFDWVVPYNGISACIADNFESFIPDRNSRINKHDIYFHHDFNTDTFDQDKIKYTRRCERLLTLLKTTKEQVIFCRRGHACHHHNEHSGRYSTIRSDIDDAEKLHIVLANKYSHLNYKILVFIVCGKCFDATKIYTSTSDKIELYNIVSPSADHDMFERSFCKVMDISFLT